MKTIILTIAAALSISLLPAQEKDLVTHNGITAPVHQSNIGRIAFTAKSIPLDSLRPSAFLQEYELTNKSNLFMTVFMGNSLTNYLHQLAPALNRDELVKNGNYQFSFYVDEHLIYRTNLHPGAPYAEIKDKETFILKPLINYNSQGALWSQSAWNRFMSNGGDSVLVDGRHEFQLEIRPYLKNAKTMVGDLIASGSLKLLVKRHPQIDISRISLHEAVPYWDLEVSDDKYDTLKIKELKGNIEEAVFKNITSIVVIKNNKLLIEEYFNGADRNTLHDTRSVGKSFASTLLGMAIDDGYISGENKTLKDFYDLGKCSNDAPAKHNITLKDLLTMSSVFDGDDGNFDSPGNEENMYPTTDWVKFALDLPVDTTQKGKWRYFTAGAVILGDILNKKVPGGLEKYAAERLFKPLHISSFQWQYTPQGVPNTAGGLQLNALDLAKYGLLYLNKGKCNGKQVLSPVWVEKTFTRYKSIPGRKEEYYGYLFWNKTYKVKGTNYETFYCAGNGGNKIFVFKDQPLVIVVTATAYGAAYAHPQVDKIIEDFVLPAIF